MTGDKSRETPKTGVPFPSNDAATDERWVTDFPNDLGCLSLSTEEPTRDKVRHRDELGLEISSARPDEVEHLHEDVGI